MQLGRHQLNAFELGAGFVSAVVGDMTCATVFDLDDMALLAAADDLTCVSLLSAESAGQISEMTVSSILDAIGDAMLVGDMACATLYTLLTYTVSEDLTCATGLDAVDISGSIDDITCSPSIDSLVRAFGNRNLKINLTVSQPGVDFSTANSGDIDYG